MVKLSDELDLPVSFTLLQIDAAPDAVARPDGRVPARVRLRRAGGAPGRGAPVRHAARLPDPARVQRPPHVSRRWRRASAPTSCWPSWRSPRCAAQILGEDDVAPDPTVLFDGFFQLVQGSLDRLYALGDPPVYEPTPERTVAAMAEAAGVAPIEMLYDVMLEHGAQHLLMLPFFNYAERNHDAIREMLLHPGGVSGLSDGGAHCGLICDASIPTFMLTHWARDRVAR